MSGIRKAPGAGTGAEDSINSIESMLSSLAWQKRLDEARAQREKVLAERARLTAATDRGIAPVLKPWDQQAVRRAGVPSAKTTDAGLMQDALSGLRLAASGGRPVFADTPRPHLRAVARPGKAGVEPPREVKSNAKAASDHALEDAQTEPDRVLPVWARFGAGLVAGVVLGLLLAVALSRLLDGGAAPVSGGPAMTDPAREIRFALASPASDPTGAAVPVATTELPRLALALPHLVPAPPEALPSAKPERPVRPVLQQPGYLAVVAAVPFGQTTSATQRDALF